MTISLSGLDTSFLDPSKKGRGRFRFKHQHAGASRDKRSNLSAPHLINDNLDYVQSQADGKYYSSKSEYRKSLKQAGMIELGNEKIERKSFDPCITEADIAEAYEQCEQGAGVKISEDQKPSGLDGETWSDITASVDKDLGV